MSSDKRDKRVKVKRSAAKRVKGWASGIGSSIAGGGRRGLQAGQQAALANAATANGVAGASNLAGGYHTARIDLPSTLSTFGVSPAAFSVSTQLHATYTQHSPAQAAAVREELHKRREQTSEELKNSVTRHYPAFIASTHELLTIEQDMAALQHSLAQFNSQLAHIAAPHFSTQDDKLYKKQKERETQQVGARERAMKEALALEEWNEDLRGHIYERKFDKAVRSIERMWDKLDSTASTSDSSSSGGAVSADMESRVSQLVDTLTSELRSVSLKRYERRRLINWLVRLGESDTALSIYLDHRESLLSSAIASIKLTGELPAYIHALSSIVFGHLAVTCKEAAALLSDDMSRHSAVLVWCQQQIGAYVARVARQTLSSRTHLSVVGECLRTAFACCASIESQGLSFSYQLAEELSAPLIDCIAAHFRQSEAAVRDELRDEQWRVAEVWVHDMAAKRRSHSAAHNRGKRALKLTSSAKALYDSVRAMLKSLMPLLDPVRLPHLHEALYSPVVGGLVSLFESYLLLMASASKAGMDEMDDLQSLSLVANSFYLADDLLPRVGRQFRLQFGRVLDELSTFGNKLGQLYEALQDNYCRKRTKYWIEHVLSWQQLCADHYSNPNPLKLSAPPSASSSTSCGSHSPSSSLSALSSSLGVSAEWLSLHDYFVMLRAIIGKCLSPLAVPVVLSACFEELFIALTNGLDVEAAAASPSPTVYWAQLSTALGYGGLLQLTRDVAFFSEAAAVYCTDLLLDLTQQLTHSARQRYCQLTQQDEEECREAQEQQAEEVKQRLAQSDELLTLTALAQREERDEEQRKAAAKAGETAGKGRTKKSARGEAERQQSVAADQTEERTATHKRHTKQKKPTAHDDEKT